MPAWTRRELLLSASAAFLAPAVEAGGRRAGSNNTCVAPLPDARAPGRPPPCAGYNPVLHEAPECIVLAGKLRTLLRAPEG